MSAVKNFFHHWLARWGGGRKFVLERNQESFMKTKMLKTVEQPKPFTPGLTKGMVRQHANALFRDKLPHHPLSLEDWVLAEKDLVNDLEVEQAEA
jgi:hypothetical protein